MVECVIELQLHTLHTIYRKSLLPLYGKLTMF